MSETLVTISAAARGKILELMKNEGREGLVLRMAVAGADPAASSTSSRSRPRASARRRTRSSTPAASRS
jgi:hypothetical protein